MNETRREALLAELDDAKKERAQLNSFIAVLSARLGVADDELSPSPDSNNGSAGEAEPGTLPRTDDVTSLVYANEFYGKQIPKAAEDVLRRWSPPPYQRPLKTTELLAALRKGGLNIAEPRVVYRSLYPSPRFWNLKGGQWGLREWYPESVRAKSKSAAPSGGPSDEQGAEDDLPDDLPSQPGEGATGSEGGVTS